MVGTAMIAAHAARRFIASFCETEMSERFASRAVVKQLSQGVDHLVDPDRVVVDVAEIDSRVVRDQRDVGAHEPVTHALDQSFHARPSPTSTARRPSKR